MGQKSKRKRDREKKEAARQRMARARELEGNPVSETVTTKNPLPELKQAETNPLPGSNQAETHPLPGSNQAETNPLPRSNQAETHPLPGSNQAETNPLPRSNQAETHPLPGSNQAETNPLPRSNQAETHTLPGSNQAETNPLPGSNQAETNLLGEESVPKRPKQASEKSVHKRKQAAEKSGPKPKQVAEKSVPQPQQAEDEQIPKRPKRASAKSVCKPKQAVEKPVPKPIQAETNPLPGSNQAETNLLGEESVSKRPKQASEKSVHKRKQAAEKSGPKPKQVAEKSVPQPQQAENEQIPKRPKRVSAKSVCKPKQAVEKPVPKPIQVVPEPVPKRPKQIAQKSGPKTKRAKKRAKRAKNPVPQQKQTGNPPSKKDMGNFSWKLRMRAKQKEEKSKDAEWHQNFRQSQGTRQRIIAEVLQGAAGSRKRTSGEERSEDTGVTHSQELRNVAAATRKSLANYRKRQIVPTLISETPLNWIERYQLNTELRKSKIIVAERQKRKRLSESKRKSQNRKRKAEEFIKTLRSSRKRAAEQPSHERMRKLRKRATPRNKARDLCVQAKKKALRRLTITPRTRHIKKIQRNEILKLARRLFHANPDAPAQDDHEMSAPSASKRVDPASTAIEADTGDFEDDVYDDVCASDDAAAPRMQFDPGNIGHQLHRMMSALEYEKCDICDEEFPKLDVQRCKYNGAMVPACLRCRRLKDRRKFSKWNDMDPGVVPKELENLTQVEAMLIARVSPLFTIYRVKHGQLKYSGSVINVPQDVQRVATDLPRALDDGSMVIFRKQGRNNTYKDFRVRRKVVLGALEWLRDNNPYYEGIKIKHDRLALLPEDGFLDLPELGIDHEEEESSTVDVEPAADGSDSDAHGFDEDDQGNLPATVLPGAVCGAVENRQIEDQIDRLTSSEEPNAGTVPLPWPAVRDGQVINEFNHVGYITQAFPTLLPWGKADLSTKSSKIDVSPQEYFRHLMRHKSGRFARDPRFPYFAMNSTLHWTALSTGRFYINMHPEDGKMSLDDLEQLSRTDKAKLIKRIHRFGYKLQGTPQFWKSARRELIAMIEQLLESDDSLPAVFVTLSAADLSWPDLHRLLPGYSNKAVAVSENPLICDFFFYNRVQELLKVVFPALFPLKDYYGRFEFQQRGSAHFHGLLWLNDCPDVRGLDAKPKEVDEIFDDPVINFFEKTIKVTTWNPSFDESGEKDMTPTFGKNPASVPFMEGQAKPDYDYAGLISYCQRHTRCGKKYCLRKDKKTGKEACRFGFPIATCLRSKLVRKTVEKTDEKYWELVTRRNDRKLNAHHRQLLAIHRANIDFRPVSNLRIVTRYLSKYITKTEPSSEACDLLSRVVLQQVNPVNPMRSIAQRALIRTVADRDYSGQEVAHTLMDFKLVLCSTTFFHLSISDQRELDVRGAAESDDIALPNFVDKYTKRNGLEDISLLDFAKDFYFGTEAGILVAKKRPKTAIVLYHPFISPKSEGKLYEEYCKQQLMLRVPFRSVPELKGSHDTFAEAFKDRFGVDRLPGSSVTEQLENRRRAEAEDDVDGVDEEPEPDEDCGNRHCEDWMQLLRRHPDFAAQGCADLSHDWAESYRENAALYSTASTWLQGAKEIGVSAIADEEVIDPDSLFEDQRKSYDIVAGHWEKLSSRGPNESVEPLRMIMTGTAGTGKTKVVKAVKQLLGPKVAVIAPTGVAACLISGQTAHSCFEINVRNFNELQDEALRDMQEKLSGVEYFILDEFSMVGQRLMGMIDSRLREAFHEEKDQVLGGRSFILVGDFGQLPPVFDPPLYGNISDLSGPQAYLKRLGYIAYHSFNKCVFLRKVVRQDSDSAFRDLLMRLRDWNTTDEDYQLLATRFKGRASNATTFESATQLFSKREEAEYHNLDRLVELSQPIAHIKSENIGGRAAERAESDDAGGLRPQLWLSRGARVMLTANVWVEAGLCNGSLGEVVDIIYSEDGPPSLPLFVLCRFPGYSGPAFYHSDPKVVPVTAMERQFVYRKADCRRKMIPLMLAWSVTVHKSQGLTLDKVIVDIGNNEFSSGLAFVALSRVRSLEDLLLIGFPQSRITGSKSARMIERMREENRLRVMAGLECEVHPVPLLEVPPQRSEKGTSSVHPTIAVSEPQRYRHHPELAPVYPAGSADTNEAYPGVEFRVLTDELRRELCSLLDHHIPAVSKRRPLRIAASESYGSLRALFYNSPPIRIINVSPDGDCFYHCISRVIFNDDNYRLELREALASYIGENRTNAALRDAGDIDEMIRSIRTGGWAGFYEAMFMAKMLQCSIHIFEPFAGRGYRWITHDPVFNTTTPLGIFLYHCATDLKQSNSANHYVVVTDA